MIDSRFKLYRERAQNLVSGLWMRFLPPTVAEQQRAATRQEVFATIQREGRWGASHESGWGSTAEYTATTQTIVADVIRNYGIRSMIDSPCGDFTWMPLVLEHAPEGFSYTGVDIVPALIARNAAAYPQYTFKVLDIVTDPLPARDLIFCRDALQHLPVADIQKALRNFSTSGSSWLLTSTHMRRFGWKNGRECRTGQCRDRNLLLEPFNLPDPIAIFSEQDASHKFLGLWKLPF